MLSGGSQPQSNVRFVKKMYVRDVKQEWCEVVPRTTSKNICKLPDQIVKGLFIGDWKDAVNSTVINYLGITHILSIAGVDNYIHYKSRIPSNVQLLMFCVEDTEDTPISQFFPLALDFIQNGVINGNVLVHCVAGVSRSAAFCIAYLIREFHKTYAQALDLVRAARPVCRPNPGFEKQLIKFEEEQRSVEFRLSYKPNTGEEVHVVGNADLLGDWKPTIKNKMILEDGVWKLTLPLYSQNFEYKYVTCSEELSDSISSEESDSSDSYYIQKSFNILSWEPCQNRKYNGSHFLKDLWGVAESSN